MRFSNALSGKRISIWTGLGALVNLKIFVDCQYFLERDLALIEINPLVITKEDDLIRFDGN